MTAPELLDYLQDRGVRFRINGNRLAFKAPRSVLTDEDLAMLRDQRDALIALMDPSTTTRPNWETLSTLRWGEDTSLGIVVPASEPSLAPRTAVAESPDIAAHPSPNWSAPDCPAWVFDDSLTVRSADVRAAE